MELDKELISEVLGTKIVNIWIEEDNVCYTLLYTVHGQLTSVNFSINKYELMYMMKKWAVDNGFSIESKVENFYFSTVAVWDIENMRCGTRLDELGTNFKTEFEAVYQACLWIKENRK
jgi:hypothetical protein